MNDSAVNDGFTRTLINANVMQIKSVCDFCQTEMIGSIAEVLDAREAAHKMGLPVSGGAAQPVDVNHTSSGELEAAVCSLTILKPWPCPNEQ